MSAFLVCLSMSCTIYLFRCLDDKFASSRSRVPSNPAVSTTLIGILKKLAFIVKKSWHLLRPSRRSRVKPGILSTSAILEPINRLNIVDFPTLGLPISDIVKISSFSVCTYIFCEVDASYTFGMAVVSM